VLVTGGVIVVPTENGLQAATDSSGCQDQLIDAARRHGLADILDELGVTSGNV
jgi:predicted HD phosphohydrolase